LALEAGAAKAGHYIEQRDRMAINWSTLQVSFYGEGKPTPNAEVYNDAERSAWKDGIRYIMEAVRPHQLVKAEGASATSEKMSQSTRSLNTVFYASGAVRVYLEGPITAALGDAPADAFAAAAAESQTRNTGLVIELSGKMAPAPLYTVKDEDDKAVFSTKDVSAQAFQKNLMGRWFRRGGDEHLKFAGENPVKVTATADASGVMRVDAKAWKEALAGNEALLSGAKVSIVVP